MKARIGVVAALLVMTLSSCSFEEHICGEGEYPVKPVDGGMGGQCVKDGEKPPEGLEAYPKGQVPEVVGDRWDNYWNDKAIQLTKAQNETSALTTLRSTDAPRGWKRIDLAEIGSIAVPRSWSVDDDGESIMLSEGTSSVMVMVESDGAATIYDRAKAIRTYGSGTTDPIFDVDTAAEWPGGTDARYVRTERDQDDGFVSREALLVAAKDGSLIVVQGTTSDSDDDISNTVPGQILRTLLLGGS